MVRNDTDGDRTLAIGVGGSEPADGMADHVGGNATTANASVVVQPGETATIVHAFGAGETAISWMPGGHDEQGFAATLALSGS